MLPSPQFVIDLIRQGGPIGILTFIVIGFLLGWIVPKKTADDQRDTINHLNDEVKMLQVELAVYQRLASGGTNYAEEAVKIAKKATQPKRRKRRTTVIT